MSSTWIDEYEAWLERQIEHFKLMQNGVQPQSTMHTRFSGAEVAYTVALRTMRELRQEAEYKEKVKNA